MKTILCSISYAVERITKIHTLEFHEMTLIHVEKRIQYTSK